MLSEPYALPTESKFAPLNALLPMLNDSDSYIFDRRDWRLRGNFPRNLGSLLQEDPVVRDAFWNNLLFNQSLDMGGFFLVKLMLKMAKPTPEWALVIAETFTAEMEPLLSDQAFNQPIPVYGLTDEVEGEYRFLALLTLRDVRRLFAQFLDMIPYSDSALLSTKNEWMQFMRYANVQGDPDTNPIIFRDQDANSNRLPGGLSEENVVLLYQDPDAYFNPRRKRQIELTDHARDVYRLALYLAFRFWRDQMLPAPPEPTWPARRSNSDWGQYSRKFF